MTFKPKQRGGGGQGKTVQSKTTKKLWGGGGQGKTVQSKTTKKSWGGGGGENGSSKDDNESRI